MGTPCVEERRGTLGPRGGPQGETVQGPRPIPKELFKGERESGLAGHPRQPSIQAPAFLTLRRGSHPKVTHPFSGMRDLHPCVPCPHVRTAVEKSPLCTRGRGPALSGHCPPSPQYSSQVGGVIAPLLVLRGHWASGVLCPQKPQGRGLACVMHGGPPTPECCHRKERSREPGQGLGGRAPCGSAHRPPSSFLPA